MDKYNYSTSDIAPLISFPELLEDQSYVYVLMDGDTCVYVGQTKRLKKRVYQHLYDNKKFTSVDYVACNDSEANLVEADTIVKLQPTLNKELPSTDKYITYTQFKKCITDHLDANKGDLDVVFVGQTKFNTLPNYLRKSYADEMIERITTSLLNTSGG